MSATQPRRPASAVADASALSFRTEYLAAHFGVTALAAMLGVSKSQPTQWKRGNEAPSPESARKLIDLDHVYARAVLLWREPVAKDWLTSANGFLDGARPIDVLAVRGASEVIDALDATTQGAFA